MNKPVLEPVDQQIADATSKPPFLHELGPDGARKVLDDIESAPIGQPEVDENGWITVSAEVGDVRVRVVKPVGATGASLSSARCRALPDGRAQPPLKAFYKPAKCATRRTRPSKLPPPGLQ